MFIYNQVASLDFMKLEDLNITALQAIIGIV